MSLLIRDARLVPVTAHAPRDPVDVLVVDGRVARVGRQLTAPETRHTVLQADGRWLIPGLWDQHVHLGQVAASLQRLDLATAVSPEDVLARVARRLHGYPSQTVIGWGHRSARWERTPTVRELDAVSGHIPVALVSGDAHHAWLNSAALLTMGLPLRDTVVFESEWFAAFPRLSSLVGGTETTSASYREAMGRAAGRGIVGLADFEFSGGRDEWLARWDDGASLVRVRVATYRSMFDEFVEHGLRTGDPLAPGYDRLTMGPLKIISDGSLNTRTAWCCEPYTDGRNREQPAGAPNVTEAELIEWMRQAHDLGFEVATHAIGDAAVGRALDAYESTGARGSIEHAQLIRASDVQRLADLRLRASVQPAHLLDDREVAEECWSDRGERCFAFRWMLEAGVPLGFGSDAPVSPLDPWLAMAAAVHRSADERPAWHPEQGVSVREALAASVDGADTVQVGSVGDLAVLDADPLLCIDDSAQAARHLRSVGVEATIVDGEVVFGG